MSTDDSPPSPDAAGPPPDSDNLRQLSTFLRGSVADADGQRVGESLSVLAARIESIVESLKQDKARTTIAPMLVDLITVLRTHRHLVLGLGLPWRGLYEYAGYVQALTHFRVLIGQWLLEGGPRSTELQLNAQEFGLVAWRTLADGMLLIDVYEQRALREKQESERAALSAPQVERAMQWWKKLRL